MSPAGVLACVTTAGIALIMAVRGYAQSQRQRQAAVGSFDAAIRSSHAMMAARFRAVIASLEQRALMVEGTDRAWEAPVYRGVAQKTHEQAERLGCAATPTNKVVES